MNKLVLAAVFCLLAGGCQPAGKSHSHGDHSHSHDSAGHGHDDGGHGHAEDYDHDHHDAGHDEDDDHGHHDEDDDQDHHDLEATQVTMFDQHLELFAEYPPFIVNQAEALITHLTYLQDWSPRQSGELSIKLIAPDQTTIQIRDAAPARAGIYLPNLNFPSAGKWRIELHVPHQNGASTFLIDDVPVYKTRHDAEHAAMNHHEDDEAVGFLKEQQWRINFSTEAVVVRNFRESLFANGAITPRAGGVATVNAPIHGRISQTETPLMIGQRVERGQKLTAMVPFLEELDDPITLREALRRAELEYQLAIKELGRSQRLITENVIPEDEIDARMLRAQTKKNEMEAAKRRLDLLENQQSEMSAVPLHAALDGVISQAWVTPGALFQEGQPLFEILDLSTVRLEVFIPESQVAKVAQADGAWFRIEGHDRVFEVGPQVGGRRIALTARIDPVRRTASLIFQVPNPDEVLRVGMFTRVAVLTGNRATAPALPASALVEEGGVHVVYVQTGGESFERRAVALGMRDGDYLEVKSGLNPGERVVTSGAYQVRLAGSTDEAPGHGHAH